MISDKNPFLSLFILRNICSGYLLDSNKYPRHIFLGILNTALFDFSNYQDFHLELWIRSIQIVVVTKFVGISNVGIKRVDCNLLVFTPCNFGKTHRIQQEKSIVDPFIMKSCTILTSDLVYPLLDIQFDTTVKFRY